MMNATALALKAEQFIEKKAGGQHSPLIAALCDMLPAPGAAWSQAERKAWLDMMEKAFTVTYGVPDNSSFHRFTSERPSLVSEAPRVAAKRRPKAPAPIEPAFYIDKGNIARKRGGDRILPHEVAGYLVDQRGMNGDLVTITWADDSQGIPKGLQLDITAADVSE